MNFFDIQKNWYSTILFFLSEQREEKENCETFMKLFIRDDGVYFYGVYILPVPAALGTCEKICPCAQIF